MSTISPATSLVATNSPSILVVNSSTQLASQVAVSYTNLTSATTTALTSNSSTQNVNTLLNINNNSAALPSNVKFEVSLSVPLMKNEQLYPTPSMKDNLSYEVEFDLRLIGCELIQTAGRLLRLPQVSFN
jgi:hypothetical protein